MNKDQTLGCIIFIGSILGITAYFYLIFMSSWILLTIQLSAFIAVAVVLLILAWIGYTLITTPPPLSIEELENLQEEITT